MSMSSTISSLSSAAQLRPHQTTTATAGVHTSDQAVPTGVRAPGSHPAHPGPIPGWRLVGEKSMLRGCLSVLGCTPEANLSDIRSAYAKLSLQWHPDRSDQPNARMKFQEISQAYMLLCQEEGDAQEIDVGLYERETQITCEDLGYLSGMAGVTSGLAGVFCGGGAGGGYVPFLTGLNYANKTNENLHLDLYRAGGVKQKHTAGTTGQHALTCTCHSHLHQHTGSPSTNSLVPSTAQPHHHSPHLHAANCGAQQKQHVVEHPLLPPAANLAATSIHELDIASAAAADVSLLTNVLAPPIIACGDNSVQVRISPLPHPPPGISIVYQVALKIKKSYQLVYQGTALAYTVPNLVPGCKYMFRVRACPSVISTTAKASGDSDDEHDREDFMEELVTEPDEATGLGIYSQPTTVTTQGQKPEGNAPHPPVLSNLQLAALKKKETKGKSKKQQQQQQTKKDDKESKSGATTPPQQEESESRSTSTSPSKPTRGLDSPTQAPSTPPASHTAHTTVATPAPTSTVAPSVATPATVSKKEAKALAKAAEDAKRQAEAARVAQAKLDEEVAYQKFLMEAREAAERERLKEEQAELERYAALKKRRELEEQEKRTKQGRNKKKEEKTAQQQGEKDAKQAALVPTPTAAPTTSTTTANGRQKKNSLPGAAVTPAASPAKANGAHTKQPLLAGAAAAVAATPEKNSSRRPKTSGVAAAGTSSPASTPSKTPAWGTPMAPPAIAAIAPVAVRSPAVGTMPLASNSPIIRSKPANGKAWTTPTIAPAQIQQQQHPYAHQQQQTQQPQQQVHPQLQQRQSYDPDAALPGLSLGAGAAITQESLLSEHLTRFDSTKPWQADLLAQQQALRDAQLQSRHPQLAYSHGEDLTPHYSSHYSSIPPASASLGSSLLPSVAWSEDDLLLSDLSAELERERERERWNAHGVLSSPTSAAAEAAWNSKANETVSSHSIHAPLASLHSHFSPLTGLRADSGFSAGSTGADSTSDRLASHDGIFMPTAGLTSRVGASSSNYYTSVSSSKALPSSPAAASGVSSYFPMTGLSRDAPSFSPMSSSSAGSARASSDRDHDSLLPLQHTRLPLPASRASESLRDSTPSNSLSGGIFSSFALPAFSSYSSFSSQASVAQAADPWATSTSSALNTSASLNSHDDDDRDLFDTTSAARFSSATADDDVIFASGIRSNPTPW